MRVDHTAEDAAIIAAQVNRMVAWQCHQMVTDALIYGIGWQRIDMESIGAVTRGIADYFTVQ